MASGPIHPDCLTTVGRHLNPEAVLLEEPYPDHLLIGWSSATSTRLPGAGLPVPARS